MALTASQQSAQDYINKIGGVSAYTATQQAKLKEAQTSGNTDMLNRLTADAARTGLSYGQTQTAQPAQPSSYGAAAEAFKQANWQNGGTTVTSTTGAQNLAAVVNQPGNPVAKNPTPYISGVMAQAQKDTAAQQGAMPPTAASQPQQTAQPVSAQQAYQPPDYAALAAARTAAALAQKRSIAATQKNSLDRSFARDGQITNDNRTLENGQINRTLNPFAGKTAFDKGIIGRERTLVDENKSGNLAAQKAGIDDLLAAYESATADEQVRIMDELQDRDRRYQLDLASQTGNLKDLTTGQTQRTLQGQQYDWNTSANNPSNIGQVLQNQGQAQQNILNQYKIESYPAEQKAAAEKVQLELKSGRLTAEAAEYNLKQLKDPNSAVNQANKIDLQLKKLDLQNRPEKDRLELQQLQKQIAEIGVTRYKPQTDTEIAMDQANLKILQAKADELTNTSSKASTTAEQYDKNLNPRYVDGDLANPQEVEDSIILSGLSDYEQFKLYKKYGLTWDDPIPSAPGK